MRKIYTFLMSAIAALAGALATALPASAESAPLATADIPDGYYYIKTKCTTYAETPYVSVNGNNTALKLNASASDASLWKIERITSVKDASHVVYSIQSCHNGLYFGYGPSVVLQSAIHNSGNGDYYITYTEGSGYTLNTEFNAAYVQPTSTTSFNRQGTDATKYYDLVPEVQHSYSFVTDEPVFLRLGRSVQWSNGGFLYSDGTSTASTVTMDGSAPNLSTAGSVWTFTGDATNGYTVTNVASGKVLGLQLSTVSTAQGDVGKTAVIALYDADTSDEDICTLWDATTSANLADGFYLAAHGYSSYVINDNGGLHLWTGGKGAGSTFRVYKDIEVPVATVGNNAYSTAYYPFALSFSEGTTAYTATSDADNGKAYVTAITDGVIPATTGVILEAAAGTSQVALQLTGEAGTATSGLTGTLEAITSMDEASTENYLVLGTKDGVLGFYLPRIGGTIAANKAYFDITGNGAAVNGLRLTDGGTTGIHSATQHVAKDKAAAIYDLSGRKVSATAKGGLYITDGKKVLVK